MQDQRIRNLGIVPTAVAPNLKGKVVGFAGLGGSGASIAEPFIRQCGVKGVKLADFDDYDWPNLNAQRYAFHDTVGVPKLDEVEKALRRIDPELGIETFPEGVTLDNLDRFLDGLDIVMNAIDFKHAGIHLELTRRARARNIPVVFAAEICYGARAVWFASDGMKFEDYFGIADPEAAISLRPMIMRLPPYVDPDAFKAVLEGRIPAPAIAAGASNIAALVAPMLEAILSGVDVPRPAPVGHYVDTKPGFKAAGEIRFRRLAWWASLIRVAIRTKLKLNHRAI